MEQDCVYYDSDQICISIPRHLYETVNSFPYVDICDEQLNKLLLGRILFRAEHAMFQIQKAEEPELSWEPFSCAALPVRRYEKSTKRVCTPGDR